ncbi:MAG: cell division protein FtsA [Candidatus Gracilibacteria bacterium]|nr:cell division protein FtsA [Candidatus Gracilibacteria bacterium]
MAKDQLIAGIDIGGSKVRTVIAEVEAETSALNVIGVGIEESHGIRKGNIVDINETIKSISRSLESAERMAGESVDTAFVSVSGHHLKAIPSRGVVAISGQEIQQEDIKRVLEAAQTLPLPMNRIIIRVIPRSFTIDNQTNVKQPIGMSGIRLEVDAEIITGIGPYLKNIEKSTHQVGIDIEDCIPSPLASADAVLSKRQRELGVVSIDVGLSSTSIAVYEEGTLLHTVVIPVGGENVTNDIAIGLRTSIDVAEKLKIEYGSCNPNEVSDHEEINLSLISKLDNHKISKKQLIEIIEARYHEIFSLVREELGKIDRDGKLPSGAILTGSSIKIAGCMDLARNVLGLPVQIGFPQDVDGIVDRIDDPSFATMLGLITMGVKAERRRSFSLKSLNLGDTFKNVGNFFKRLVP